MADRHLFTLYQKKWSSEPRFLDNKAWYVRVEFNTDTQQWEVLFEEVEENVSGT